MSAQTVTGKVVHIERKGHTVYGNPIMVIAVSDDLYGEYSHYDLYRVSDNASMVYEIENPEYRDEPHTFALTRAGRISHVVIERCEVCGARKSATHDLYCPRSK